MKGLTQKQILRDVRKSCTSKIALTSLGWAFALAMYHVIFGEHIARNILSAITTLSYLVAMIVMLCAMLKLNTKNMTIARDKCVSSLKETDTLSEGGMKYTLNFETTGAITVLEKEFNAAKLGKEYYIARFGKNQNTVKLYSADKYELDKSLQPNPQPTIVKDEENVG